MAAPPEKTDLWTRWGLRGKTGWDWLNLLIVPVMLALVGGLFTTLQIIYQTAAETQRERIAAKQSAELQRFIEEFRVQETSLQAYLDLMARLLLENDLRSSQVDSEVRAIAQAQTLTTLRKQDTEGKRAVVLFLSDAEAIQSIGSEREPPISLAEADLERADLNVADLSGADLYGTNLSDANLFSANLSGAELRETILSNANLQHVSQ